MVGGAENEGVGGTEQKQAGSQRKIIFKEERTDPLEEGKVPFPGGWRIFVKNGGRW